MSIPAEFGEAAAPAIGAQAAPHPHFFHTREGRLTEVFLLSLAVMLSAVAGFYFIYKAWKIDWEVPLNYNGDGIQHAIMIRGYLDSGSFYVHPRAGAPGVLDHRDYPNYDQFGLMCLRLIAWIRPQTGFMMNAYFAASFPLIALAAFWSLRYLGISRASSYCGSLIYAFLPFHRCSGTSHLFLTNYFWVAPTAAVIIKLAAGTLRQKHCATWLSCFRPDKPLICAALIFAVLGQMNIYFAVHATLLTVCAVLVSMWYPRQLKSAIVTGGLLLAVLFASVYVQLLPTFNYIAEHGRNWEASRRWSAQSDLYALRITYMVIPILGHRLPWLYEFRRKYDQDRYYFGLGIDEGGFYQLGSVATVGFLSLILVLFIYPWRRRREVASLSLLNMGALLYGTTGGFAVVMALLLTPQFRVPWRIIVYVTFLCLYASMMLIDRLRPRLPKWAAGRLYPLFPIVLAPLGVLDMIPRDFPYDYEPMKKDFATDREFVQRVEEKLQPGAMVYQLPFREYPEALGLYHMDGYDHARAYIHGTKARWSFPAMKQRRDIHWNVGTSVLEPPKMIDRLRQAGFKGLWIDRRGYEDNGTSIITTMKKLLPEQQELESKDKTRVFFTL